MCAGLRATTDNPPPPFTYLRWTLDPCLYRTHHLHPSTAWLCVYTFLHTHLTFTGMTHDNDFFIQAPCCSPLFCPWRLCCTGRAQPRIDATLVTADCFPRRVDSLVLRSICDGQVVRPPTQVHEPMLPTQQRWSGVLLANSPALNAVSHFTL